MSSVTTAELNNALNDEIEAINSIYGDDTITLTSTAPIHATLRLPTLPFTFLLSFNNSYPVSPPSVNGTASTGSSAKGEGETAVKVLADTLGRIYNSGEVCLFDLIEETTPLLTAEHHASQPAEEYRGAAGEEERSEHLTSEEDEERERNLALPEGSVPTGSSFPQAQWTASEPLSVQKSTFLAHAAPCHSRPEALAHIATLISGSKKIAGATHNITAYRIRNYATSAGVNATSTYVQDCDDDGETAAGGRLLHLLQLMDAGDVVMVVTRWYGGVKLGGERFRCIGKVAREALVAGGWGRDGKDEGAKSKTHGKNKK